MIVWGASGHTSWSLFFRNDAFLNSGCYISVVPMPATLPFIQAQQNATFQQNTVLSHDAAIIWTYLDTENIRLLPRPPCTFSRSLSNEKKSVQ